MIVPPVPFPNGMNPILIVLPSKGILISLPRPKPAAVIITKISADNMNLIGFGILIFSLNYVLYSS
jgi:hypothetical protein